MKTKRVIEIFAIILISISFVSAIVWSDDVNSKFTSDGTNALCINGLNWQELDSSGNIITSPTENDCYRASNSEGADQMCCPANQLCQDQSRVMKCITPINRKDYCNNFTESNCEDNDEEHESAAVKTVEILMGQGTDFCQGAIILPDPDHPSFILTPSNCHCTWKENTCTGAWDLDSNYNPGGPGGPGNSIGTCTELGRTTEGNCDTDEFLDVKFVRKWVGIGANTDRSKRCVNSTSQIPCGSLLVKLPFFTLINLIIVIIALIIFYYIYNKKH